MRKLVEVPIAVEVPYPVKRTDDLRSQYENASQQKPVQLQFTDPQSIMPFHSGGESQTSVNHSGKPLLLPHSTKSPKYRKELLQSKP